MQAPEVTAFIEKVMAEPLSSIDKALEVWSLACGQCLQTLRDHSTTSAGGLAVLGGGGTC